MDDETRELASRVVSHAVDARVTLACVESCTGGLVGAALTSVPGSSGAFAGGLVTYSNSAKVSMARVDAHAIERHGAVSARVAAMMARGGLDAIGADRCVSVTGVAGPDGGSEEKPVGTVWIALAAGGHGGSALCVRLGVDEPCTRERVRERSVIAALTLLDPTYDHASLPHERERRIIGADP